MSEMLPAPEYPPRKRKAYGVTSVFEDVTQWRVFAHSLAEARSWARAMDASAEVHLVPDCLNLSRVEPNRLYGHGDAPVSFEPDIPGRSPRRPAPRVFDDRDPMWHPSEYTGEYKPHPFT